MQPRIELLPELQVIGMRRTMTFANNETPTLWQTFMPRRGEIKGALSTDLLSIQVYPETFNFKSWDFYVAFDKWAAVEVADADFIPAGMESFSLPGGLYAVFEYKGLNTDTRIFEYIFGSWLPMATNYQLANRPHFERLGTNYRNNDTNSEEEIWIPISQK